MNHIVDTCPLTTFKGGLNLLHESDNYAVIWLEFTATAEHAHTHAHTHTFNCPFSRTNWVSWYQRGKTNLDFTIATDRE